MLCAHVHILVLPLVHEAWENNPMLLHVLGYVEAVVKFWCHALAAECNFECLQKPDDQLRQPARGDSATRHLLQGIYQVCQVIEAHKSWQHQSSLPHLTLEEMHQHRVQR